jgi:hypothetical protein
MGLGDISGFFSRFFVVGFLLPSLFTVGSIAAVVEDRLQRGTVYYAAGGGLFVALLLVGLRTPTWSGFEGYFLGKRLDPDQAPVLDTRFGKKTQNYRNYVNEHWGIDAFVAWPYIESLLSDRERDLHVDARAEAHFFLNSSLGAIAVAATVVVNVFSSTPFAPLSLQLVAAGGLVALAYLLYRWAGGAAARWGELKAAAVALHRFELYEHLGLRRPSIAQEREVALRVSRFLRAERPRSCPEREEDGG